MNSTFMWHYGRFQVSACAYCRGDLFEKRAPLIAEWAKYFETRRTSARLFRRNVGRETNTDFLRQLS